MVVRTLQFTQLIRKIDLSSFDLIHHNLIIFLLLGHCHYPFFQGAYLKFFFLKPLLPDFHFFVHCKELRLHVMDAIFGLIELLPELISLGMEMLDTVLLSSVCDIVLLLFLVEKFP